MRKREYIKLNAFEREKAILSLSTTLNSDFILLNNEEFNISFRHKESSLNFQLILGDDYHMGLSEEEESAARKLSDPLPFDPTILRPAHDVYLGSFLLSQTPIQNAQLASIIDWDYDEEDTFTPANVDFETIKIVQNKIRMHLPTEEQWEYACRGNTSSLFVFGNFLPLESELKKWLDCDFSNLKNLNSNLYGLYGLFAGEWCSNDFRENYTVIKTPSRYKTLRGGGSLFYPWQDDEWIWCMSSMRMSEENMGDENKAAFRLCVSLDAKC